jgi:hypothetical protein
MSRRDEFGQVAITVPIAPIAGVTADEVQTALEQIYNLAKNASRGAIGCGFDGNASTGRWLEFFANNPSNDSPFVVPEPGILRAISASSTSNATCVITVFKNGVSVATLSFSAAQAARDKTLNVSVTDLDEISVQVTSGSISRPTFFMFVQTL